MRKGLEQHFSNITFEPQLKIERGITEKLKRRGKKNMGQLLCARDFIEDLILTTNLQDL